MRIIIFGIASFHQSVNNAPAKVNADYNDKDKPYK
jgi:hypothetical protein